MGCRPVTVQGTEWAFPWCSTNGRSRDFLETTSSFPVSRRSIAEYVGLKPLRVVRYLRVLNGFDVIEFSLRRCLTKLDVGNRGVDGRIYGESRMPPVGNLVKEKRCVQSTISFSLLIESVITVAE